MYQNITGYNHSSSKDYYHTGTWTLNLRNWGWFKCQFCHLFSSPVYTLLKAKEQRCLSRLLTVALQIFQQSHYTCKTDCILHISLESHYASMLMLCWAHECMSSSVKREKLFQEMRENWSFPVLYDDCVVLICEIFIRQ